MSSGVGVQSRLPFQGKDSTTAPATTDAQSTLHRRRTHHGHVTISRNTPSAALCIISSPTDYPDYWHAPHSAALPQRDGVGGGTPQNPQIGLSWHRPKCVSLIPNKSTPATRGGQCG